MFIYIFKSKRVYNQYFVNIELDSVYGDLLNDYLEFFLPTNERDVNFPSFSSISTNKKPNGSMLRSQINEHPSLLKRVVQKSLTDDMSMLNESDRASDMKKIHIFLGMINECLVYPFTELQSNNLSKNLFNRDMNTPIFNISLNKSSLLNSTLLQTKHQSGYGMAPGSSSPSSSPIKYQDFSNKIANIEIIFMLSMILKHSHFFSNSNPHEYKLNQGQTLELLKPFETSLYSRKTSKFISSHYETPIDELRT